MKKLATDKKLILVISSWLLASVVVLLAGLVWWQTRGSGSSLSAYSLFPLFGLLAFSIMWTHYILGSLRRYLKMRSKANQLYFTISGIVVLLMILLHPGILIAQLYRDGLGLPPQSFQVAYPESRVVIMLGSIALTIFLIFEFKKRFSDKKWWRYIELAQVFAMILIYFHGLSLGPELSVDWYRAVWHIYGLSFLLAVGYNYWQDKIVKGASSEKQ